MKRSIGALLGMIALTLLAGGLYAQVKAPLTRIEIPSKAGNVTYYHFLHARRANNDCKVCHPALFAQDAKASARYADHTAAEAKSQSCGFCHRTGGTAFESKGNCTGACHSATKSN